MSEKKCRGCGKCRSAEEGRDNMVIALVSELMREIDNNEGRDQSVEGLREQLDAAYEGLDDVGLGARARASLLLAAQSLRLARFYYGKANYELQ